MKEALEQAKRMLAQGSYTCVITDGREVHTSCQRGVAPLLELYDKQICVKGFVAADKVVGKAAAFLYVALGVRAVFAGVISRLAQKTLEENGIEVQYETLVAGIQNRSNTGPCPMEQTTKNCNTPEQAISAIRQTQRKLQGAEHMKNFENVKKNFGFGCMRLPMINDEVDTQEMCRMVDAFLAAGFNYFDTAHGYLNGKSETALKECLVKRYPRESYILTNKLSTFHFKTTEEIRPLFESQLEACGVEYFDFYLMHAQDRNVYEKYKKVQAYETALEFLKEGRIKHFGISFHDTADLLDRILTEYPQVEVVQIQLNYVDFDDPAVQSRKCLEVCRKHGKPAIIMEPVKGGALVNLPQTAQEIFDRLQGGSNASYAIRFAASQEGVFMVLSGMGSMEMMEDNISYMQDFKPLNETETAAVEKVCQIFRSLGAIPCTACRYCAEVCPQKISIPDLFACMNAKKVFNTWNTEYYYSIHTKNGRTASSCLKCGMCEDACPQHLEIRKLLEEVAKEFEK